METAQCSRLALRPLCRRGRPAWHLVPPRYFKAEISLNSSSVQSARSELQTCPAVAVPGSAPGAFRSRRLPFPRPVRPDIRPPGQQRSPLRALWCRFSCCYARTPPHLTLNGDTSICTTSGVLVVVDYADDRHVPGRTMSGCDTRASAISASLADRTSGPRPCRNGME